MKDLDPPGESSEQRAKRQWGNYDLTRRWREEVKNRQSAPQTTKTEPDIAEVITTDRPRADKVTRFQNSFVTDFKTMLAEHKRRNVALYRLSLLTHLRRLKREKLKRRLAELMAQQAQREAAQIEAPKPKKDLFS
jgi:hypothetical protein